MSIEKAYIREREKGPEDLVVPLDFADFGVEVLEKQIVVHGALNYPCSNFFY